jgi:hypothetical protein
MQKIILDSTYLLPLIGIDVGIPDNELRALFDSDNQLYVNEISIFEVLGKGLRELIKDKLPFNRFQIGLMSLWKDDHLHWIKIKESLTYSDLIKRIYLAGLEDIPDCIILGTAMQCDVFITEAKEIPKISTSFSEFRKLGIFNWAKFKQNF